MHPRGPSPGVVVTLPLFQENQSTNGTPRRQRPRNQPAAHKCGGSPAPLSSLQQGALLKYSYKTSCKTNWLTLEKQAPNREETVPGCTHRSDSTWCMESMWLPSFDSLLPLPSAGAAGAVSGNYGAGGVDPQDTWSRQLPGPSLPESSPAGLAAHEQARPLDESPSLLVQACPAHCATGQESRDELLGQE